LAPVGVSDRLSVVKSSKKIRVIGLTGGVASGKSTVAAIFREHGITVVDLDAVGREISERPAVIDQIAKLLGPGILNGSSLDRAKLRERIFSRQADRLALEKLLHPLIWKEFKVLTEAAAARGEKIIVCEAALLVESGAHAKMDGLIVVSAPEPVRRDRLFQRDRISEDLALQILLAQSREEDKLGVASIILYNDGSPEKLRSQVENVIQTLGKPKA